MCDRNSKWLSIYVSDNSLRYTSLNDDSVSFAQCVIAHYYMVSLYVYVHLLCVSIPPSVLSYAHV